MQQVRHTSVHTFTCKMLDIGCESCGTAVVALDLSMIIAYQVSSNDAQDYGIGEY